MIHENNLPVGDDSDVKTLNRIADISWPPPKVEPSLPVEDDMDLSWAFDEIDQRLEMAETDPRSARRLAELYELVEYYEPAQIAWRRAAALGDPDAIDYVREILSR